MVADGHCLPFADGAFSYAIAIHVLEHATDPSTFSRELTRVAPAGFVQVPSREAELAFGWPFHPWLIDKREGTFYFEPRGAGSPATGGILHEAFAESALFRLWFGTTRSRWHHSLEWRQEIPVHVQGALTVEETAEVDVRLTVRELERLARQRNLVPLPANIMGALRCPSCSGRLRIGGERASCEEGCGRSWPMAGPVPILLEEAAG